ncbi:hypothetical protein M0813_16561 [Anaeramoeba flamelloides]|uniref:Uncharacterized protein n=1 Tax=Anaeramoeba flamelloides TaxID=1746091 RepID=A0ABQ8YZH9_9EUKA|nr:hypothetical protein M0813_16561 [Anaeramoeba flamelloides]
MNKIFKFNFQNQDSDKEQTHSNNVFYQQNQEPFQQNIKDQEYEIEQIKKKKRFNQEVTEGNNTFPNLYQTSSDQSSGYSNSIEDLDSNDRGNEKDNEKVTDNNNYQENEQRLFINTKRKESLSYPNEKKYFLEDQTTKNNSYEFVQSRYENYNHRIQDMSKNLEKTFFQLNDISESFLLLSVEYLLLLSPEIQDFNIDFVNKIKEINTINYNQDTKRNKETNKTNNDIKEEKVEKVNISDNAPNC